MARRGKFLNSHVEHSNGNIVISASTSEYSIGSFFRKTFSLQATNSLAKILAYRCLQSGIDSVKFYKTGAGPSEREQTFLDGLKKYGLELGEVDVIKQIRIPGVDYEKEADADDEEKQSLDGELKVNE